MYVGPILQSLIIMILMAGSSMRCLAASKVDAFFGDVQSVPGWSLEGTPYHYNPKNLYDYIDGGADFFLEHGFVELTGANYTSAMGKMDSVTIDIYDPMMSNIGKFDVYYCGKIGHLCDFKHQIIGD